MTDTSLDPIFIPASATRTDVDFSAPHILASDLRHTIAALSFNEAYDFFRQGAAALVEQGRTADAIELIRDFDALLARNADIETPAILVNHAALLQVLTALHIIEGDNQAALATAATALQLLSQQARRKDEPFLATLASLLYDIALVHNARNKHRQAEREIEKSLRLFERLCKINPERYGSAQMLALGASTSIYQSRQRQAETLVRYQADTARYMQLASEGNEDAAVRLIESLATEGRTLVDMNRQREAVQYFTRALKFLTKLSPEFDLMHLQLSIDLGEAMLALKPGRDKGIHLLNTMLYKASRLGADDQHRRIVNILLDAKNPSLDIFSFWHKLFPR